MVEAPASEKQKEFLGNLGVEKLPEGLTKGEASLWIEELVKARDAGATQASRSDMYVTPPRRVPSPSPPPQEFKPASQLAQEPKPAAAAAPVPVSSSSAVYAGLTDEQIRLLKAIGRFPSDASADELSFGLSVAQRLGLDPFRKQIRFLRFHTGDPIEPFVTIDGLYTVAARTGEWAGIDLPTYEVDSGHPEAPVSASVTVYRMIHGARSPFASIVRWSEFVKKDREGNVTRAWREMPYHMLGKVARAQAIRMAFPEYLAGVYEESEGPTDGNSY